MKILACDVDWTFPAGGPSCPGTLYNIEAPVIPPGMTTEDAVQLGYQAMILFAIVFGLLALKKALT
jgi:hypothetical protein